MRSAPAASPRRPPSGLPASGAGEVLEWSAASARRDTAGSAAVSTDYPGQDRARGGSHAPPQAALPPGRQGQGRAVDAEPVRGLTPWVQRPLEPGAEHERGRLSRGISENISVPGRGARAAAVQSASDRKREPPLPSRSRA